MIVILFPFLNGEIQFDRHHVQKCHHQPVIELVQPIERDTNFVPRLIEGHHVLVRINDLLDVLVVVIPPDQVTLFSLNLINVKFVFNVLLIVIDLDDALDFEHIDQQVLEEPDLDLLLNNDERSILQFDDSLVDLVDHRHDTKHDRPPFGQWRFEVRMGVHVFNDLMLA